MSRCRLKLCSRRRWRVFRHETVATDQHRAPRPTRIIPTVVHDTPSLPRAQPSTTSPLYLPHYEYSLAARCYFAEYTLSMGNATPFLLGDADSHGLSNWEAEEIWEHKIIHKASVGLDAIGWQREHNAWQKARGESTQDNPADTHNGLELE